MQKAKGVRLWLERRKGRPAVYYIRDKERRISTGCAESELPAAEEKLREYLTERHRPDTGQRDLSQILMADVMNLYATDIAPGKASRETIMYHMKALTPFWGTKTLADVKGKTCRKYLDERSAIQSGSCGTLKEPPQFPPLENREYQKNRTSSARTPSCIFRSVKPSTVRRELKTLQAAINHWHKESPLIAVPKVTLPEEGERRERVLERNEVAAMLRAARRLGFDHVARFIILGVYTGTRHNALLRLRWVPSLSGGHIDLDRGIIYRRGSAEKDTSKRRPPVSATKRLLHHLRRWAERDYDRSANVIHYQGSPILKMKRAWAKTVKEAGLGRDVTPHTLRHTCASWALWEGKTIWDVAGIIGADASTIEKVYGHHRLDVEERKRA